MYFHYGSFLFTGEISGSWSSRISIEPVGSPPMQDACGLYCMEILSGVLVALGFLQLARSFTLRGTSSAEGRTENLLVLGLAHGAATGPVAPMGHGCVEEKRVAYLSSEV